MEYLDLGPFSRASGTIRLPGSKSISNRVLLLAALAAGTTAVHDLLDSDDTRVMLAALEALGCGLRATARVLHVTGIGGALPRRPPSCSSATPAPRCARSRRRWRLATLQGGEFELRACRACTSGRSATWSTRCGSSEPESTMRATPAIRRCASATAAPIAVEAPIRVRGDVSSQFLTALLLALPLATESGVSVVRRRRRADLQALHRHHAEPAGALRHRRRARRWPIPYASFTLPRARNTVAGRDPRRGRCVVGLVLLALGRARRTAPVRIEGVGLDSIQGDIRFVDAARAMGAQVDGGAGWLEVRRGACGR
jgi:3-phosphoshikimate 1-carboxyvinyltransferase